MIVLLDQAKTDDKIHSLHVTVSVGRQWTFANMMKVTRGETE